MKKSLDVLAQLSNKYGSDPAFVIAGGGNTSCKNDDTMWIKPSGISLASITAAQFLPMNRRKLDAMFEAEYPADRHAREEKVKTLNMGAVCQGASGRPSVEAPLHNVFEQTFVVHTHPALVNGMTCSLRAERTCRR